MHNPVIFLLGYKTLCADISHAAEVLNLCGFYGIPYRNQKSEGETVSLECSLFSAQRLKRLCEKNSIPLKSVSSHGLPALLYKYRHRYGILLGIILGIALIYLSGIFLWDIRIDGESRLTEKEVIEELNACGLYVGMPTAEIDADVIQNRVMIYSDDISWISINLSGTVAHVEIREAQPLPQKEESFKAANLVATDDGEITGFEEVKGEISVKIGDLVRAGDLLVSGIRDSSTLGFTYLCADGKVFAKVRSDYEVQIPLEYNKKIYCEKTYCEKYIVFFNKEIKIYSNNRKIDMSCDIIDTVEYANFFSLGSLPFGIRTVRYLPYQTETATRSTAEAIDLALYKLRLVEEEKGIGDICTKKLDGTFEDGAYRLRCSTTYIKNISKQLEIKITG